MGFRLRISKGEVSTNRIKALEKVWMMKKSSDRWEGSEKEQGIDALPGVSIYSKKYYSKCSYGREKDEIQSDTLDHQLLKN